VRAICLPEDFSSLLVLSFKAFRSRLGGSFDLSGGVEAAAFAVGFGGDILAGALDVDADILVVADWPERRRMGALLALEAVEAVGLELCAVSFSFGWCLR
jgi:hypothetical protein